MDDEMKKDNRSLFTRRYFLEAVGGGAIGCTVVGSAVLTGQFLSPNVLREPPLQFKAGGVEEFPVGSVTLNREQKVFIVRANEGSLYALTAVCTHLGCITNWKSEEGIIACPCHGSVFDREGRPVEGPAPRSLPRFAMSMDEQGHLIVDKATIVGEDSIFKV